MDQSEANQNLEARRLLCDFWESPVKRPEESHWSLLLSHLANLIQLCFETSDRRMES